MTHRKPLASPPSGGRRHGALAALCALALVAAACSSDEGASAPRTTVEPVARTTTSVAPSTTEAPAPDVNPELLFVALTPLVQLDQPVAMTSRSGTANLYVAERSGIIRVIEISENRSGELETELVDDELLDIEDDVLSEGQEQGLLGITFSTDGRRLYVSYTNLDGNTRVDEYKMETSSRDEEVDERSRREILAVDQPFPNHNGGHLAFGPDGFLYIGLGDGGGAGDPLSTGQNPDDLLGSILRLDPDTGDPDLAYDIPTSNPFSLGGGTPEVWLYGVRNPWRFSFDLVTGDLWVADVGQNEVEEINRLPASDGGGRAANLGWAAMEGDQPFEGATEPDGHVHPIHTYGREDGNCSVTGGYVYRGTRIGGLAGSYVYGDFCRSTIRALLPAGDTFVDIDLKLAVTPQSLGSFGEGPFGELYALETIENGQVYRIDPFVFE